MSARGLRAARSSLARRAGLRLWSLLILVAASTSASAHHERTAHGERADGVSIPSLTHGQMKVISDNLQTIRALADAQMPTDPVMRRLQGFVNLQSFVCLWGNIPGSLTDERSPFNECAHAYLAGARALLVHLQEMPGPNRDAVRALVTKIEGEMLANNASLTLCRYSEEPFSTSEVIAPHWSEIPLHPPSLMTFAAAFAVFASVTVSLSSLCKARPPSIAHRFLKRRS